MYRVATSQVSAVVPKVVTQHNDTSILTASNNILLCVHYIASHP